LEAYDGAIMFYVDQLGLHKQLQQQQQSSVVDASGHRQRLSENFVYLSGKLSSMEESRKQLVASLELQTEYARLVEHELISLKPQLAQLRKQRNRIVKLVAVDLKN